MDHRWKFFRAGGVEQVELRDAADLSHLRELDPKLWVALAMPVRGIEADARTLAHLDADGDGRVRIPEVIAALDFLEKTADLGVVFSGGDSIALAQIRDAGVSGAARRVLGDLGKTSENRIALSDLEAHAKIVAQLKLNGDGVLPLESADDVETRAVLLEILDTIGGTIDKGGARGVTQSDVDRFFAEAQALSDWHAEAERDSSLMPLGAETGAAAAALAAVRGKIEDYFTRCRLAKFDARAAVLLNGSEADLIALATQSLSGAHADVAKLPLARIEAGRPLPLRDGINPAWTGPMALFSAAVVAPLLGGERAQLSEGDWAVLDKRLAPHLLWAATRPVNVVDKLGVARLRAILAGPAKAVLGELIAKDLAQETLNAEVALVERLLLYQRDLRELLENFVSFARFYRRKPAVFQAGTLYLDGRACGLAVEVTDLAKHAALAGMASTYLAYCDVTRGTEKRTIAAAFTGGDADHLFVGRNGVFYDRKGRDWDATISKIIANPISVREAFWAPYKKFARFIDEQVAKRSQAAEAQSTALLASVAEGVAHVDTVPPPAPKKVDVGTVAALGVAVGGVGAIVVGLLTSFFGLGIWMPLGLVGLLLVISGPSVLLAVLKLRQRSLGPVLDANGWAINGRARINVPFGGALTMVATLPQGSQRSFDDPYADRRRPWKFYTALVVLAVLAISWYVGKLDPYLPSRIRSTTVLGSAAPAAQAPPVLLPVVPEAPKK